MIVTQCAACAKPLAHDAPRCIRCWTRYCDASCQLEHWSSGHKKQCKKIALEGGAEAVYADAKYKEAAAAAAEESAPLIPADAICFICREDGSRVGLVTRCGCDVTAIAHVSCLVRLAQVAVKDDEEMGLREGMMGMDTWAMCAFCNQLMRREIRQALGWAAWKTYSARPENNATRLRAMSIVAEVLRQTDPPAAFPVTEGLISLLRRFWPEQKRLVLVTQENLACSYEAVGRFSEALDLHREVHAGYTAACGEYDENTIRAGNALAQSLMDNVHPETVDFVLGQLAAARQALGDKHVLTVRIALMYGDIFAQREADPEHWRITETVLSQLAEANRQVLGKDHELTRKLTKKLQVVRQFLHP